MPVIGVDEHRWSHTRPPGEDGFVTVIIDLTPVLDGTGRARLLDLVPGRSAAALRSWLSWRSPVFRDQVQVVAMDGFGGYESAATDQLPGATTVMGPFHVVALAGAKLDECRQRVQQQTCGQRQQLLCELAFIHIDRHSFEVSDIVSPSRQAQLGV